MGRALVAVLAVASVVMVAGCASAPESMAAPAKPIEGPSDEALLARYYDARWSEISQAVPSLLIPIVSPGDPVDDSRWKQTVADCVVAYGLAPGDVQAYRISELVCKEQYPSITLLELSESADDRDEAYAFFSHILLPCLLVGGQEILDSPAVQNPLSADRFSWRVNERVGPDPATTFRLERCPRVPSD